LEDEALANDWLACHQCDALYVHPQLNDGQRAECGRCGATLFERKVNSIERTFALSVAGLILLIPAIMLPIMGITLAGQYQEASLLDAITQLIVKGYFMVATLVFMFTIAVPTVKLIGALIVFAVLTYQAAPVLGGFLFALFILLVVIGKNQLEILEQ